VNDAPTGEFACHIVSKRSLRFIAVAFALLLYLFLPVMLSDGVSAAGSPTPVPGAPLPKPGPGVANSNSMTIYTVTNPNSFVLTVNHNFTNSSGFQYSFSSQIPANRTVTYHVSNIPQIPTPFQGAVTLSASSPFTAQIVGYDIPLGGSGTTSSSSQPAIPRPLKHPTAR